MDTSTSIILGAFFFGWIGTGAFTWRWYTKLGASTARKTTWSVLAGLLGACFLLVPVMWLALPQKPAQAPETQAQVQQQTLGKVATPIEATQAAEAPAPVTPTLGLSKDQILAGLDDFLPALQSSPMGKGKDRLMGETNKKKALTLVEIVGEDANHPYYVSLMMFMPSDAPVLLLGNMTMYGAVTKNIFPDWDGRDRLNWLTDSIKTLQQTKVEAGSPPPSIEKKIGDKVIRIKLAEALSAVLVTIEHKDAPQ